MQILDTLAGLNIDGLTLVAYCAATIVLLLLFWLMYRIVLWAKNMPKGAFIMLAVFPLISLFPIPHQEIKKIERIKQQEIKAEDESGEPPV